MADLQSIKRIISGLSEEQRKDIQEAITIRRGVCLLLGKPFRERLIGLVMALLDGKDISNPQVFRNRRYPVRNGKVKVTKVSPEKMEELWRALNG
jgi:hypothetical protein